jgi:SOS-response transcriptional repressor LexA
MHELGQAITRLLERRRMSMRDLARRAGVSPSYISALCRSGITAPNRTALERIEDALGVSDGALMLAAGYVNRRASDAGGQTLPMHAIREGLPVKVPILGGVRAGDPGISYDEIVGYEPLDASFVRGSEHFFVYAEGESLRGDGVEPGDLCLVRRQDYVDDNHLSLVCVADDGCTLKFLRRLDGQVMLYSRTWGPEFYPADSVRILGVVVKSIRYHERRLEPQ